MGEDHLLPQVSCERLEFNTRSIQPGSQFSEEFPNTLMKEASKLCIVL